MPFKLKLKKSRAYNVASKSLFVISVELLDGGIADCTLSVDSTGQECLDNVCQRQAINQPEFFGLRYFNNNQQYRWIELDRPLKKQLDKYASSHQLHLRIMYYITSGTSLITDEVTRNHYFLQLKNDLLEGRIVCDYQEAVVLASYSRQAEYGNHDKERHTVEYLKNLLTFPKQIIDIDLSEAGRLEWLTSAVIKHHVALHNMSQAQAENSFISVCQQLRFYGQELFTAREGNTLLTIAVSLNGISLLTPQDELKHMYRWEDITNVINQKRTFTIELTGPGESVTLQLASPDEGKYVWRMCIVQHTFHKMVESRHCDNDNKVQLKFQDHSLSESRDELDRVERSSSLEPSQRAYSTSCLELSVGGHSVRSLLPQYRPAPDYETAIQQKYQQQREAQTLPCHPPKPIVYGSHPDIHRLYPDVTRVTPDYGLLGHNYTPFAVNPNVQARFADMYKPPPPYPSGLASNSTPDLAVTSQLNYLRYINPHFSGSSPDLVSTRTALNRQYLGYINNQHMVNYRPVMASTHGTYNNLSSVLDIQSPYINDVINRYRDLPNVPAKADASEPIYENIPLPWQNDKTPTRDRAQSLSTTEEIARLNERNGNPTVAAFRTTDPTSHYMNAQMIRDSKENMAKSMNKSLENITTSIDRLSLSKSEDETPYQSLSISRVNNNIDNVTSISVPDIKVSNISIDNYSSGIDSGIVNSAYNTSLESEGSANTTKNVTTSSKEKKRRRWGMFMGRGEKSVEVKSATLGRDKSKNTTAPANKHRWSTGLPKFQPLPPSITKETLCQLLERKMSDNQLSFAFEQIPKGRETGGELTTALLPENAAINGYNCEYLPYEDNRVRLHPTPQNRHGYINASHITMTVGSSQRFYMVAKIPPPPPGMPSPRHGHLTPSSGALLWEGAWVAGARVMALLGETADYVPALHTKHDYGKLSVWCESRCVSEWGVTSCLRVSGPHPPARTLYHVHFTRWPTNVTVPNIEHFLSFLSELSGLRLACATTDSSAVHSKNAPLIICCDLGAGKSGVTLAADLLTYTLDHNQELDIPRTVTLLNQQRANLIQNVHQYKFLHQILLHYLKQSRLI